jgi:hypothetical protein
VAGRGRGLAGRARRQTVGRRGGRTGARPAAARAACGTAGGVELVVADGPDSGCRGCPYRRPSMRGAASVRAPAEAFGLEVGALMLDCGEPIAHPAAGLPDLSTCLADLGGPGAGERIGEHGRVERRGEQLTRRAARTLRLSLAQAGGAGMAPSPLPAPARDFLRRGGQGASGNAPVRGHLLRALRPRSFTTSPVRKDARGPLRLGGSP